MRKFIALVKKELQELLTLQMILPLVVIVGVFYFIGQVVNSETQKTQNELAVAVVDMDHTAASEGVVKVLEQTGFQVRLSDVDTDKTVEEARNKNEKAVLVIPEHFDAEIQKGNPQKIQIHTIFKNFSVTGSISSQRLDAAITAINDAVANSLIAQKIPGTDPTSIKKPVQTDDFVVIGDKQAHISPSAVAGFITSQTTFIPIVLFFVIVFASQLIVVSVAAEKENKTLEVLLSSPVSRQSIVAAKLFAAGIVSLLMAGVYIFGMRSYVGGLTGAESSFSDPTIQSAIQTLGLQFSVSDYVVLGICLFVSILAALALSVILGSFAEDTKSAQGLIAPLMIMVLIPYFLTLFLDISTLSPTLRWLVYAIPFSHTFAAAPNLILGQDSQVWMGIGYLTVIFIIFVLIASKIFSSEKIFTLKLNFKRRERSS